MSLGIELFIYRFLAYLVMPTIPHTFTIVLHLNSIIVLDVLFIDYFKNRNIIQRGLRRAKNPFENHAKTICSRLIIKLNF